MRSLPTASFLVKGSLARSARRSRCCTEALVEHGGYRVRDVHSRVDVHGHTGAGLKLPLDVERMVIIGRGHGIVKMKDHLNVIGSGEGLDSLFELLLYLLRLLVAPVI